MSLLLLFNNRSATATASITEADDSLVSTATVLVSASAAITEGADSLVATSTVAVSASEASTEANDSVAATVTTSISASASITEAADSLVATATATQPAAATVGTMAGGGARGGNYNRREVDRAFREYLKKQKRGDEQVAAQLAKQAEVVSIAALVDHNARAAVLTDQIKANDDEEAIMVLLLAA